jgi:hypothetical protein
MAKSIRLMKLFTLVSIILPAGMGLITGCGPTKQEMRKNDAAAERERIQADLKNQAELRAASGDNVPLRVADPGYPVANCITLKNLRTPDEMKCLLPDSTLGRCGTPNLSDDTVSVEFVPRGVLPGIVPKSRYVCGNTKAGAQVVAWRRWYCRGSGLAPELYARCVLSEWRNGSPTFGNVVKYLEQSAEGGRPGGRIIQIGTPASDWHQ